MKKHRESIFKAFTILEVFVGILCVLMFASITEAGGKPFKPHTAKGDKRTCTQKLNSSINGLKACNTNLVQALRDLGTCNMDLDESRADLETCSTDLDKAQADLGVCNTDLNQAVTDLGTCNTDLDQSQADLGACNAALSLCESNRVSSPETASVAKTGQTTSYTAGDDGDLQEGIVLPAPRFIDNGNGTVTDNLTGLIWMKDAGSIGAKYWVDAVQSCSTLAHGAHGLTDGSYAGDWRLPNVRELYSLVDFGHYNYALPDGYLFMNVMNNYWSSTTYAGNPYNAFYLNAMNGLMASANKTGANVYVLCVRGGS
jgi:hypothetical protein